jgi:hypothetical protein
VPSGLSGEHLSSEELLGAATVTPGAVAEESTRAQQVFAARAYMIVADNRCIWSADEGLTLHPEMQGKFIKILP